MFTGIVEEIGTVKELRRGKQSLSLTIQGKRIVSDIAVGDSIAVNGICLTVTSFINDIFSVDVMPKTIEATTLRTVKPGSHVNLERAMQLSGRFGGHIVSGHVDDIGEIVDVSTYDNAVLYKVKVPIHLMKYCLLKGSITLDGTSLTLFEVDDHTVTVSLIPHTRNHTILGAKTRGDFVNIECDMLGKYVERLLFHSQSEEKKVRNMGMDFLANNGFL